MAGPPSTDLVRSSRACMAGAHTKGGITLPYTNTSPNECGNFRFMRKTHAGPPRHSARSVAAAIPGVDRDPLPRPGDAVYAGGVCYPHSDADQSLATALHLWQLDRHPGLRRGVVDVRKQRCTVSSGTPTPSGNRRSVSLLLRTRSLKGSFGIINQSPTNSRTATPRRRVNECADEAVHGVE